ncbi:MAG: hypothetical protein ACI8PT_000199 [Gammaproteobacteria bacterium]
MKDVLRNKPVVISFFRRQLAIRDTQVVGREGNKAKAIRSLLRIVGIRHNSRINLKIEEPIGGSREFSPAPQSAMDKVIDNIKDVEV